MSRGSKLVVVPMRIAYPEYASWWKQRGIEDRTPAPTSVGIFVGHPEYGLISGAQVLLTDGAFMFLEHFSVSPKLRRLWAFAARRTLKEYRALSPILNKWPLISTDRKSLARICISQGFGYTGSRMMTALPPT